VKRRLFHGWWMVGAGCALQVLQSCLLLQAFGAYVAILRDERGWSKTELAGAAALHQVEAAILGPILGWMIDRFGAQGVIRIGVVVFGVGFMLLSTIDSLIGFYAAFVVVALGASLAGFFPINVALIHWFERKRARALSSVQFGFALGGIAMPAVAWSLATFGWRVTAFASGIIIIVVGFPLSLVMRRRPEDYGERVDGEPAPPKEEAAAAVSYTRYPPKGVRGVAGTTRATRFGRVKDYAKRAHEEICVLVQVETQKALDNIEAIAAVDGVDGVFIGPADLHASLGHMGETTNPKVVPLIDEAIRRIRKGGKAPGILTTNEELARRQLDGGALFVAVGNDIGILARGAEALAAKFKS